MFEPAVNVQPQAAVIPARQRLPQPPEEWMLVEKKRLADIATKAKQIREEEEGTRFLAKQATTRRQKKRTVRQRERSQSASKRNFLAVAIARKDPAIGHCYFPTGWTESGME